MPIIHEAHSIISPMPFHVAVHEAGHAAVAHVLGFTVRRFARDGDGFCCMVDVPDDPTDIEHWSMALIALAGPAAERAVLRRDPGSGGDGDHATAADHIAAWSEPGSVPIGHSPLLRAASTALSLVTANSDVILALAERIAAGDGDVPEIDVAAILGRWA